jgi:GNAT superfamily N-acetyltransferase
MQGLVDGLKAVALRKMFVAATHRGRELAIAQRLLNTFNQHCGEVAVRKVLLGTTQKYHAAHRFYERNGFCRVAEIDLPPNFPRMPVDDVFYQLTFKS